jgi:hypothetical protein
VQGDQQVQFKEGAVGELHVDNAQCTDKNFVMAARDTRKVVVLRAGTELRVALTIKPNLDEALRPFLLEHGSTLHEATAKVGSRTRFVSVWLRGLSNVEPAGLWFVFRWMDLQGIASGMVELPEIRDLKPVESLNQAFTRLSEVFEPWRKAHTGNIYERVLYEKPNGHWGPLGELRDRTMQELLANMGNK